MRALLTVVVLTVIFLSALPAQAQQAKAPGAAAPSTTAAAPQSDSWRFRWWNDHWWYYQTNNRWVIWQNDRWQEPRAASYMAESRIVQSQPIAEQQTGTRMYRRPSPTRDQVTLPASATNGGAQPEDSQSAADLSLGGY